MTDRMDETSPQAYARIGGVLGLIIFITAIFNEGFVRGNLIVSGDATATAINIIASEQLFRLGFAGELIRISFDIALAWVLYVLLKPVNKNIALLAVLFGLAAASISGINALNDFVALLLLSGADYLTVFAADQLHGLAMLSLNAHTFGYHISLVFFGFHLFLIGYLVFRSGYFPKLIGLLLTIASLSYLTNSFANILNPEFAETLFPTIFLLPLIGEMSFTLWLLVMGVNMRRWNAKQA
jgi:hypothetical protein